MASDLEFSTPEPTFERTSWPTTLGVFALLGPPVGYLFIAILILWEKTFCLLFYFCVVDIEISALFKSFILFVLLSPLCYFTLPLALFCGTTVIVLRGFVGDVRSAFWAGLASGFAYAWPVLHFPIRSFDLAEPALNVLACLLSSLVCGWITRPHQLGSSRNHKGF